MKIISLCSEVLTLDQWKSTECRARDSATSVFRGSYGVDALSFSHGTFSHIFSALLFRFIMTTIAIASSCHASRRLQRKLGWRWKKKVFY
jgi:hypothetical protein